LSPRGGIALVRAAQAWAFMAGHRGVHPEDVQAVLGAVVAHRLDPSARARSGPYTAPGEAILNAVPAS
jgi:MoxR-like ATPase